MKRSIRFFHFAVLATVFTASVVALSSATRAAGNEAATAQKNTVQKDSEQKEVELFSAMRDGTIDAKIIVRNDHEARIFLTNRTDQPLSVKLPEAFAAVPALAQFGGGGGGRSGGSGRSGGGGGGQQQSSGGGLGGGGGGGIGGGGGQFSIAPEKTERIDAEVVCLDHGLVEPSSSKPYKLVPADEHLDRPAVVELLKALGRGELNHNAAQAAAWHLNNDMTWNDLAAKLTGTRRSVNRSPYFSRNEIQNAMSYATAASSLAAQTNVIDRAAKQQAEELKSSEARSTTDN